MNAELLQAVLGWAVLINIAVLLIWWIMLSCAHDWICRMHQRWFPISAEDFDRTMYLLFAQYKLGNFLFFIAPYLALRLAS